MATTFPYNVWSEAKTKNGFNSDEIISSLQKSIRRGLTEQACEFAYELYVSSPMFLEKMWRRLLTISVEDIGFGNVDAAVQINTLNQMRQSFPYDDGDQPMYFIHAIRVLSESEKDRSSDLLKNIIIKGAAMGKLPEVMDVALDKHTKRGSEMGRGSMHFFTEGTIVVPEKKADNDYKERYLEILKVYKPEEAVPNAFKYNNTQY